MLYTGDEIGYIQKWDLKKFLRKLRTQREDFEEQLRISKRKNMDVSAFLTQ